MIKKKKIMRLKVLYGIFLFVLLLELLGSLGALIYGDTSALRDAGLSNIFLVVLTTIVILSPWIVESRYKIDIPDNIKDLSFPPMMIQPLVENAIKHGLEPKIEGGEISIEVDMPEDILRVKISDTGLGFKGESGLGVGLSNIRERLQSLYDDNARLTLKENLPSGLKAIIEVPLVTN